MVKDGLHGRHGLRQGTVIDVHVQVGGGTQLSMAKKFLRHFQVSSRFHHSLCQGVTEQVRMDSDPGLAADISQRRLKGNVRERLALASAQAQPGR